MRNARFQSPWAPIVNASAQDAAATSTKNGGNNKRACTIAWYGESQRVYVKPAICTIHQDRLICEMCDVLTGETERASPPAMFVFESEQ